VNVLVAYFSVGGRTAKVAAALAKQTEGTLFEIKPVEPYTAADIKWVNPLARCNKEKFGNKDVPVEGTVKEFDSYDTVFIGFPIWYGGAPNVVNTFCKGYKWSGKKVYAFATSGGSGIGKTAEKLKPYVEGANVVEAKLITGKDDLANWMSNIG